VTLTRWFRERQRYMIVGLVVLLMVSWGVLGTVRNLVSEGGADWRIHGRTVQRTDLADAQQALRMLLTLRLADYGVPAIMERNGAPLRATVKAQALAADFREFVFPGDVPAVNFESAWRYLILLFEADAAGVQVTDGEISELLDALPQFADQSGFRADIYAATLAGYGLSDADMARWFSQFARIAKLIILRRQSVLASDAELWMNYVYGNESASILYVEIEGALFRPLAEATDEELIAFFEEHRDYLPEESPDGIGYKAPARVKVQRAMVRLDQLQQQAQVSDEEAAAYYEEHKEDYRVLEEAAAAEAEGQQGQETPAEPSYKPLDEVRDEIRQKVAALKAAEEAEKLAQAIMTDLQAVQANYENLPQPLEQMARRYGAEVQVLKTADGRELISREELTELAPQGAQVAQFAFEGGASLYLPTRFDSERGPVIVQMLEYREPEQQSFGDVREQVKDAYMERKAVQSAETFAGKLKERADEAGMEVAAAEMSRRLAKLVPSVEGGEPPVLTVQESGFFRRASSLVAGLQGSTQDELVRRVFDLSDGQTDVATTGTPPTTVYVIQLSERRKASPERFASMDPMERTFYVAQKQRLMVQAWLQGLLKDSPVAAKVQG